MSNLRALPIPPNADDVAAFPTGALPSPLADLCTALVGALQVPPALPGMLALAAASAVVQRGWQAEPLPGWREPCGLFCVVALPPGERKSATLGAVLAPLRAWEAEASESGAADRAAALTRREALESQRVKAIKAEQTADAEALARQLATTALPPVPRLLCDDVTSEALGRLLCEHGSLGVFSAEAGLFSRLAGRYTNAPDFDVYLGGHAGDPISIDRRGGEPVRCAAPSLAMGLAVQPSALRDLGAIPGAAGRGLLGRMLFALPTSRVGRRRCELNPVPQLVTDGYANALRRLLVARSPERRTLVFSAEATAEVQALLVEIEPRLGPEGDLSRVVGWGAKLAGAVCRIATVFALVEHGPDVSEVSLGSLRRARALVPFLVSHARQAWRVMAGDPREHLSDPVIAALAGLGDGPGWSGTSTELRAALLKAGAPHRSVPVEPRAVSALLSRSIPKLDALGVDVTRIGPRKRRIARREGA